MKVLREVASDIGGLVSVVNRDTVRQFAPNDGGNVSPIAMEWSSFLRGTSADQDLIKLCKRNQVWQVIVVTLPVNTSYLELVRGSEFEGADVEEISNMNGGFVHYVLVRANEGPAGPMSVAIGGDCLRPEATLTEVFERASLLATAMRAKARSFLPSMPGFHAGKKGALLLVDRDGERVVLSNPSAMALSAPAMVLGVGFANRLRVESCAAWASRYRLPLGVLSPDSLSPDVVTGGGWTRLAQAFRYYGLDSRMATCQPGKTPNPSSVPTGQGVATAALEVAKWLRESGRVPQGEPIRVLVEAAGAVTQGMFPLLLEEGLVKPEYLTFYDPSREAIAVIEALVPGCQTLCRSNDVALSKLANKTFDILINNGLGNHLGTPKHMEHLGRMVRSGGQLVVLGGANNIIKWDNPALNLPLVMAERGIQVIPDTAVSGGGWTLALAGQAAEVAGVDPSKLANPVSSFVCRSVSRRIQSALVAFGEGGGDHLWKIVSEQMEEAAPSLDLVLPEDEWAAAVDPRDFLRAIGVSLQGE